MEATLSPDLREVREPVSKICADFNSDYWLKKDQEGGFPADFHRALTKAGWLAICIPKAYGGSGLGITEATVMMQALAESGADMSGESAVHMNVFGPNPMVVFGTEKQKQRMLPPLIAGHERTCFAVTEPDTGLNTTQLKTRAVRAGSHYVVHGTKSFISTASIAEKMPILVRTLPLEEVKSKTDGLSLFYTDFDRRRIEVHEIEKIGREAVDTNYVFIDDLRIPAVDRIGEEGKGFQYILHGVNAECTLVAGEAVGLGRAAMVRAAAYAKERIVSDRPIGENQAWRTRSPSRGWSLRPLV